MWRVEDQQRFLEDKMGFSSHTGSRLSGLEGSVLPAEPSFQPHFGFLFKNEKQTNKNMDCGLGMNIRVLEYS